MTNTLTLPRLIRWSLIVVLLGCLFGLVIARAQDGESEGCDPNSPTEVCVYVYFPADGWCHWLEPYSPLWDFLNCRQTLGMTSAMVAQSVDTVADFGDAKVITIRQRYADGTTVSFDRFVRARRRAQTGR